MKNGRSTANQRLLTGASDGRAIPPDESDVARSIRMSGTKLNNPRKRRVFDSVFQLPSDALSQPTPVATPANGFTALGQAFGRPVSFSHDRTQAPESDVREPSSHVKDQVRWDRSWHTVTDHLSLSKTNAPVVEQLSFGADDVSCSLPPTEILEALRDVLEPAVRLPHSSHREDLAEWHSQQVRRHFMQQVLPLLAQVSGESEPASLLPNTVQVLDRASGLYIKGLSLIARQLEESSPGSSRATVRKFRRDLHALFSRSMSDRVSETLRVLLSQKIDIVLDIRPRDKTPLGEFPTLDDATRTEARHELLSLVESLHNVGLGGEKFQVIFAELMNEAMSNFVDLTYSGIWDASPRPPSNTADAGGTIDPSEETSLIPRVVNNSSPSQCVKHLCEWIENQYSRLAVEVLSKLDKTEVAWNDVEKWKEMSIGRLAGLRTSELFDIVVNWPNSNGALDDLRTAVTTPQRRLQLTDAFSAKLQQRLLHPGASTLQILRTYISMIWSFHSLDHSRVLLDRVAYSLQVYLCSREDTVRIIITGLLSDTEDADGNPIEHSNDKLVELAILLDKGLEEPSQRADEDLDWDDMDWIPDPVDAGPGYKRSKSADIVGTLIGVLGSQEVFIKEFQTIVGENLLKHEGDFEKEIKVLELLKLRFGDAPLQSCEVMIKDIQDSRPLNAEIRRDQHLDRMEKDKEPNSIGDGFQGPSLHARILSRLFWPQLPDATHLLPKDIADLQRDYEKGFSTLKNARKLTWLPTLGTATVELELTDRNVVFADVHTWQATVVWAFGEKPQLSFNDLVSTLEMDEALVRSALTFWVAKMVLYEVSPDVFAVHETLSPDDRVRWNAQVEGGTLDEEEVQEEQQAEDKLDMYWTYIQGMLKNSAAQMPVQQISMMLKMLIVDGFPHSNDELKEFLGRKVAAGELEVVGGGKYRLKK